MNMMKNKIRAFSSAVSVMTLTVPALVRAQFNPNVDEGGDTGLPVSTVFGIIESIMFWLLALVGIIGVIGFAIAGILYLTAAGDETRIGQAKNAMMYSIIGVIVAIVGLVALNFANNLLGGGADDRF